MSEVHYESTEQAAEALASAIETDQAGTPAGTRGGEPVSAPVTETTPQAPPAEGDQPQVDISKLPPEAQQYVTQRERQMQADYTRKTQELATQRQEAEQAMQFIQALNSDPNFAAQVVNHLSNAYAFNEAQTQEEYGYDEYGNPVEPDPYMSKITELEQWKNGLESQIQQQQAEAQIHYQLSELRSQNPSWTDDDLNDVLRLGFATGGNLHQAAELYKGVNQRTISRYVEQKSSVTAPAPVSSSTHGHIPEEGFHNINDPAVRAAAMERIRNEIG
jgi:hypothetical protein